MLNVAFHWVSLPRCVYVWLSSVCARMCACVRVCVCVRMCMCVCMCVHACVAGYMHAFAPYSIRSNLRVGVRDMLLLICYLTLNATFRLRLFTATPWRFNLNKAVWEIYAMSTRRSSYKHPINIWMRSVRIILHSLHIHWCIRSW